MTAPAAVDYRLGAVLPHVKRCAEIVGPMFGLTSILGWRASARDLTGHPAGRALDFMCDPTQGDGIAEFLLGNAGALGVEHVIWKQRYREPGGEWEPMADRGSPTQNHMDHVHAKFNVRGGDGTAVADGYRFAGASTTGSSSLAANWQSDVQRIAITAAAVVAAGALIVFGLNRTVSTGKD